MKDETMLNVKCYAIISNAVIPKLWVAQYLEEKAINRKSMPWKQFIHIFILFFLYVKYALRSYYTGTKLISFQQELKYSILLHYIECWKVTKDTA